MNAEYQMAMEIEYQAAQDALRDMILQSLYSRKAFSDRVDAARSEEEREAIRVEWQTAEQQAFVETDRRMRERWQPIGRTIASAHSADEQPEIIQRARKAAYASLMAETGPLWQDNEAKQHRAYEAAYRSASKWLREEAAH